MALLVVLCGGCGWVLEPPLLPSAVETDAGVDPPPDRLEPPDTGGGGGACAVGALRGCYTGRAGTQGVGACRGGMQSCTPRGQWGQCQGQVLPAPEACNGIDDDCNGLTDDGLVRGCFNASPEYVRTASPLGWTEVCAAPGRMLLLPNVDDDVATVPLPFAFPFYGVLRMAVALSSNGLLSFGAGSPLFVNTPLPESRVPDTVFAFWDDLYLRAGICVAAVGTAPSRLFVSEWTDAFFYPNNTLLTHLTFEVVLSESGSTIDVLYHQMSGEGDRGTGLGATIGLAGGDNGLYDQVGYDTAGMARGGAGYRWSPSGSRPVGTCMAGSETCRAGAWSACAGEITVVPEVCDNLDNDCNGAVDDGVVTACYTGPPATQDVGACHPGARICHGGVYGSCAGAVLPIHEICGNGIDDDCDNVVDNGC